MDISQTSDIWWENGVGFRLEIGMSGFGVDAVPFLLETRGISQPIEIGPRDWLSDLRKFLGRSSGDALLLGEVNLENEDVRRFFGSEGGDELQMCLSTTSQ